MIVKYVKQVENDKAISHDLSIKFIKLSVISLVNPLWVLFNWCFVFSFFSVETSGRDESGV